MDTDLYSMGAFFCDQHPELVDEVVRRSVAIEERGLEAYADERGRQRRGDLQDPAHRPRRPLLQGGRGLADGSGGASGAGPRGAAGSSSRRWRPVRRRCSPRSSSSRPRRAGAPKIEVERPERVPADLRRPAAGRRPARRRRRAGDDPDLQRRPVRRLQRAVPRHGPGPRGGPGARPATRSCFTAITRSSVRPVQQGFIAAEAAAKQDYVWQYVYLFFANQDEAERVGVHGLRRFLEALAGSIAELESRQWERRFRRGRRSRRPIHPASRGAGRGRARARAAGRALGDRQRARPARETLQDSPSLDRDPRRGRSRST